MLLTRPTRGLVRLPILALLLVAASTSDASPQARPKQRQAPAPVPRIDKKKEAMKVPPLDLRPTWSVTLPGAAAADPAYDGTRAYVPLKTGRLVAVSLRDGATAWSVPFEPQAPPAAGQDLVHVPGPGIVRALDASSGKPRWQAPIAGNVSAPLVWQNGWLAVATDQGALVMLRADSGATIWTQPMGAVVRLAPVLAGDRVYALLDDSRLVALSLQNGAKVWETTVPGKPTLFYPLDDRIYVGSDDKFFYCFGADKGRRKWRWRTGGRIVGTVAVDEDKVYFVSRDNVLRALDRVHGNQEWKQELKMRPADGPLVAADLLLVSGQAAEIDAFQPVDGSEAGSLTLAGEPVVPPHLVPVKDGGQGIVVITGEGQMQMFAPPVTLPSKPIPGLGSTLPLPPPIEQERPETDAAANSPFFSPRCAAPRPDARGSVPP